MKIRLQTYCTALVISAASMLLLSMASPSMADEASTKVAAKVASSNAASGKSLVNDTFTDSEYPGRSATRGDWKVVSGVASVSHDDKLYKQYKDHGPMLSYPADFHDGEMSIDVRCSDCKLVVLTFDGDGHHAVRMRLSNSTPGAVFVFVEGEAKPVVLNNKLPVLADDTWTKVTMKTAGELVMVTIGDAKFEHAHPAAAQVKKVAKVSFAFGDFAIRRFAVTSED